MTKVTLWLGAPDAALETTGSIYREGADLPVARGVALAAGRPWAGELGEGCHRYVFEVVGGAGPFSLWVEEREVWRQLADFGADHAHPLHVHRFEVLGTGPVALAEARLRRALRAAAWSPGGEREAEEALRPAGNGEARIVTPS